MILNFQPKYLQKDYLLYRKTIMECMYVLSKYFMQNKRMYAVINKYNKNSGPKVQVNLWKSFIFINKTTIKNNLLMFFIHK